MKRIVLVLLFFCLTITKSWSAEEDSQYIPITVLDNTGETGRTHRSMMFIPMEAYYDANTLSVYVQFLQDIGCVDITILNKCTGNYTEYKTDSCMGVASLSISGDEGDYSIVFLLSNGVIYEGVFLID